MSFLCILAKRGELTAEASGWKTYVALRIGDRSVYTRSIKGHNPEWDGDLELELDRLDRTASVELWQKKLFSQHLLGRLLIPLDGIIPHKPNFDDGEWYTLWMQSPNGSRHLTNYRLLVDIRYDLPTGLSAEEGEVLADKLRLLDKVFEEEVDFLREQHDRIQCGATPVPSLTHQTTSEKEHSSTPSNGESDERKGNEVVEERRHPTLNSQRKSVSFAETSGSDYPDGRDESSDVEKNSSIASQRNSRESSADLSQLSSSQEDSSDPGKEKKAKLLWTRAKTLATQVTQIVEKDEDLLEKLPHLKIFFDRNSAEGDERLEGRKFSIADVVVRATKMSKKYFPSIESQPAIRQRTRNISQRRARSFRNFMKKRKTSSPSVKKSTVVHQPGNELLRDDELRLHVYKKTLLALIYPISKAHPHNFDTFSAHRPVFCYECGGLLWGLARQGLKCKECGVRAHRKCKDLMNADCLIRQAERGLKRKDRDAISSAKKAMIDIMKQQQFNERDVFEYIRTVFEVPEKLQKSSLLEARETISEGLSHWSAKVTVKVIEAQGLAAKDRDTGTSDPYVTVKVGRQKKRTQTILQNLNPHWDREFQFECHDSADRIKVRVWDEDDNFRTKIKNKFISEADDFLGQTIIEVRTLCGEMDVWYNLEQRTGKSEVSGAIHLQLSVQIEGEESRAPYHLQYTSLHETMFHFEYIRNLDALSLPSERGAAEGWKVYFGDPAQKIVTEFATRYGIEDIYRAMTHFSSLSSIYNESGVAGVMSELLTHINDHFLCLGSPGVNVQPVVSADRLQSVNFPIKRFQTLLESLRDRLKIDLCGYRDTFPSSEPDKLDDMKASVDLLTNVLYFQMVVLKEKGTPKCEVVIVECVKECLKRNFFFIKSEIINLLGDAVEKNGEINVDETGEFSMRPPPAFNPFVTKPAQALEKLLDLVVSVIEEDKVNYMPFIPKLGDFNLGETSAEEMWTLYEDDLLEVLSQALSTHERYASTSGDSESESDAQPKELISTTEAINLLFSVKAVYDGLIAESPRYKFDDMVRYPRAFAPYLLRWFQENDQKQIAIITNAVKTDRETGFQQMSAYHQYSSSVVDVFCSLTEIFRILTNMDCPDMDIRSVLLAQFSRLISNALSLYADLLCKEMVVVCEAGDVLKSCTLLNNFVEMRELLSKLYQDMGGGEMPQRSSDILNHVQNKCLADKLDELVLIYAQSMEPQIVSSVQAMRVKLVGLRNSDRNHALSVIEDVMRFLDTWKDEVKEKCERTAVKKVLKILWQMIISHVQKIIVLPPLPDLRDLMKSSTLDLNDDQTEGLRICIEELKDFFSEGGLKRSAIEKSKEMVHLQRALELYGQGTDELIGLFVKRETAQGSCLDECVGELQMQVSLFETSAGEYRLTVKVVHATDLKWPASFGIFRPYVELTLVGPNLTGKKRRQATHSKGGGVSPTYNETFHFNWRGMAMRAESDELKFYELHVCVKDYCFARADRVVGVTVVRLQEVAEVGSRWMRLALIPAINVSDFGRAVIGILVGRIQDEIVREFVQLKVTSRDRELDA